MTQCPFCSKNSHDNSFHCLDVCERSRVFTINICVNLVQNAYHIYTCFMKWLFKCLVLWDFWWNLVGDFIYICWVCVFVWVFQFKIIESTGFNWISFQVRSTCANSEWQKPYRKRSNNEWIVNDNFRTIKRYFSHTSINRWRNVKCAYMLTIWHTESVTTVHLFIIESNIYVVRVIGRQRQNKRKNNRKWGFSINNRCIDHIDRVYFWSKDFSTASQKW